MSPEDQDTLELLEVLATGKVPLPADLRRALQDTGLTEPDGERYRLSTSGTVRLEKLRSGARH